MLINYNKYYGTYKLVILFKKISKEKIMRMERLELSRIFSLGSKSSASTIPPHPLSTYVLITVSYFPFLINILNISRF